MFAYRLAKELGVWDVNGMLRSMTMEQLEEWATYSILEPFGEERADLRAGVIASTIANVNRTKASDKVFGPQDFLLKFGEDDTANQPFTDVEKWNKLKSTMKAYATQQAAGKKRR